MANAQRADNVYDLYQHAGRSQVACSRCTLSELCLPRNLSEAETQRFEQIVHRSRPIQPGEHLFRAGDPFKSVANVRSGCFKSYVIDQEGQEQVVAFHLPGEIIGLDAIHDHTHMTNVVALDTSSVCGLTFESVTNLARHMPDLQSELFRVMSHRISELEINAADLSADQRIARFLISLSERFSRRGFSESEFILAMSRRDIASYLRLATETVSRVLARFQKADVLWVERKQVKIINLDDLKKLAGHG